MIAPFSRSAFQLISMSASQHGAFGALSARIGPTALACQQVSQGSQADMLRRRRSRRADKRRRKPESPARRVGRIARVGARYGFGFVFKRRLSPGRRREEPGRVGTRLRQSLEEVGPTFAELGRFLSVRRDLIPPDIAAELERTRVVAKPIAFAETRAYVERELGNTLERLFVEFDEVPVRVGPFTQSHRAVLPGGRPALVVVRRTGVRRDLLAMRPVADLTRRRLGDQLPLDPSAIVTEFAAHVNQRRDMFASAQITRRL